MSYLGTSLTNSLVSTINCATPSHLVFIVVCVVRILLLLREEITEEGKIKREEERQKENKS